MTAESKTEETPFTEEDALRMGVWVHQRTNDKHDPENVAFQTTISWFFQKAVREQLEKMGFTSQVAVKNTDEACLSFGKNLMKFRKGLSMNEWFDKDWRPHWYDEEALKRDIENEKQKEN